MSCFVCGANTVCPNNNGAYDCTPFCNLCEGDQVTSIVCPECESAKGNWEDSRLDDYGRLIK